MKVEHFAVRLAPAWARRLTEKGISVTPEKMSELARRIGKPGKVSKSVTIKEMSVSTLHLPPDGEESSEADSFENLRTALRRIYDISFKDTMHRGHDHDARLGPRDGNMIMCHIRLQLTPEEPERLLKEHNWHEALALITSQQLSYTDDGKVESLSCSYSGGRVRYRAARCVPRTWSLVELFEGG